MIVYVVVGSSGEYEDHCQWSVKGFVDKSCAQEFKIKLNQLVRIIEERSESIKVENQEDFKQRCVHRFINSFDPNARYDYYLVYGIEELDLDMRYSTDYSKTVVEFNSYQLANLRWMFRKIWNDVEFKEEFNTGDWFEEVPAILTEASKKCFKNLPNDLRPTGSTPWDNDDEPFEKS